MSRPVMGVFSAMQGVMATAAYKAFKAKRLPLNKKMTFRILITYLQNYVMIENFKVDLKLLSSTQLIRKYIYNKNCDVLGDDKHFQLKEEICEHLKIEFNDVVLVGSAKLGFSIKPSKRYVAFGDDSDIDIAIVSTALFQKVWEEAFLYKKSGVDWPAGSSFFKYLSQGWIRPDKLPTSEYFAFTGVWWDFFNNVTSSKKYGPYKIRAGLYHSSFFLQEYQKICIEQCIEELA